MLILQTLVLYFEQILVACDAVADAVAAFVALQSHHMVADGFVKLIFESIDGCEAVA